MESQIDLGEVPGTNGASPLPPSTYMVRGDTFAGQRFVGEVEPHTGSPVFSPWDRTTDAWQLILYMQDHHKISLTLQSLLVIEPEVLGQIQDGTESARYTWLNHIEAMGIGWLKPNLVGIGYQIYTIS